MKKEKHNKTQPHTVTTSKILKLCLNEKLTLINFMDQNNEKRNNLMRNADI